ncbi:MAG: head decoration protein [Caulobacterales bacterium]|uniref:head decoration protein n=1 Tax=Glycocaulis sp. TaxID=1969725 RepID=UPI003FA12382
MSGLLTGRDITEPRVESDIIKSEHDPFYCRENFTLLAGSGGVRTIAIGTILGLAGMLSIASAANGGNTGNGTVSAAAALKAGAQVGAYAVEFLTATTFAVFDPSGNRLADGATGAAYDNGQIGFTITAGGTAFEAGDGFTITVSKAAGKAVAATLDGVDGSQIAAGVAVRSASAADGADGRVSAIVRGPAVLARNHLVYPAGATDAQKARLEADLEARGIIFTTAA